MRAPAVLIHPHDGYPVRFGSPVHRNRSFLRPFELVNGSEEHSSKIISEEQNEHEGDDRDHDQDAE